MAQFEDGHKQGKGRPSPYSDKFCQKALELCQAGATDSEIAEFFGVSARTIYRWKLEYPDFCQAMQIGKEYADSRVERSLYQKATGYNYIEQQAFKVKVDKDQEEVKVVEVEKHCPADFQSGSLWLRNRQPERWRDKQEVQHSGDVQVNIGIYPVSSRHKG